MYVLQCFTYLPFPVAVIIIFPGVDLKVLNLGS